MHISTQQHISYTNHPSTSSSSITYTLFYQHPKLPKPYIAIQNCWLLSFNCKAPYYKHVADNIDNYLNMQYNIQAPHTLQ